MNSTSHPRRQRAYGDQSRSGAGRHFIQTQVHSDVYLRVRALMERHNISASGAVHHLLRERFGLDPLPPLDSQATTTSDSTHPHGQGPVPHLSLIHISEPTRPY